MRRLLLFLIFAFFTFAFFLFTFALTFASQSPLVVPDGTGASVRAGFNNAIDSLNTIESGPSAPTTTEPYMLWADTTNNLLKQMNSANTAWVVLGSLGVANLGLQASPHLLAHHLNMARRQIWRLCHRPVFSGRWRSLEHWLRLGDFLHGGDGAQ